MDPRVGKNYNIILDRVVMHHILMWEVAWLFFERLRECFDEFFYWWEVRQKFAGNATSNAKVPLQRYGNKINWPLFRLENGAYDGEDDSNVKVELTCVKMPQPRKVSKMINGLGEDM